MSTQTAESVKSIVSLEGILETPFFQGIVPITQEEEERVQQKMKKGLSKDSPDKGDVLGDLLPYEKALFIRAFVAEMDTEKELEEMGHPLMALLSGDRKKMERMKHLSTTKEKTDQLRDLFWSLVNERFADALSGDKVTGLRISYLLQVITTLADENSVPCPRCGKYHG